MDYIYQVRDVLFATHIDEEIDDLRQMKASEPTVKTLRGSQELESEFKRMDANGDGGVHFNEFRESILVAKRLLVLFNISLHLLALHLLRFDVTTVMNAQ